MKKVVGDRLRAIAANGDDRVDAQLLRVGDDLGGNVTHHFLPVLLGLVVERIAAIGGAEDGAAARQNPAYAVQRKLERFLRPDQPVEAVRNSDDFPLMFENRSP